MKKYYIYQREKQIGPLSLAELKSYGIDRNTLVWYEGLPEWIPAGQSAELQSLFHVTPTAVFNESAQRPREEVYNPNLVPKKSKAGVVIAAIIALAGAGIGAFVVMSGPSDTEDSTSLLLDSLRTDSMMYDSTVSYSDIVIPVNNAREFLKGEGSSSEQLRGEKVSLNVSVENSSPAQAYRNIILEVKYFSDEWDDPKTTLIQVPNEVKANSTLETEVEFDFPDGAKNLRWKVAGAELVN